MATLPRSFVVTLILLIGSISSAGDLRLWYNKPANPQVWEEALPLGSGRLGAMVFGGTVNERIQFNEDTLWTGKPHNYVREGSGAMLEGIRESIFAGRGGGGDIREKFLSDPIRQKAFQPFGDLLIESPGHDQFSEYRRELDLETAVATTSYRVGTVTFTRETIASHPDNAIVTHIRGSQPGSVTCSLLLTSPHSESAVKASDGALVLSGQVLDPKNNNDPGLKFEARLLVRSSGGTVEIKRMPGLAGRQRPGANQDAPLAVQVSGADQVTVLVVAATSFVDFQDISADPSERCGKYVAALNSADYDALKKRHVADHQALFNRVKLDLARTKQADLPTDERLNLVSRSVSGAGRNPQADPGEAFKNDPALAVLYFQMGRYMLIASSRRGTQPANLQGVWNQLLDPPWESKYTTNINLEMNYWPAEVTNLAECHEPVFDMVDDLRISGARTAKKMYNCSGWVLHHNTDHWRGTAPINNVDGLWPTGAAWLCHHMWDHYLYSGDKDFLAKRAYPAMKEACQFFLDFLVKDPETGWLVTCPSHSPEQAPPQDRPLLTYGPTMDNQLIRSLFAYTIEAAEVLKVDSDFAAKLGDARKQLPPNQVGSKGQLQEWIKDWDAEGNRHRHMSPLWGMYPGWDITPDDPKVWDAAKVLLGWRGDGDTGWSYSWRAALWARVHDGDTAYRQIYLQLAKKTFPNLFDKCGPFQVDGDFGSCGAVAEMLIQSHLRVPQTQTHIIDVLPALPKAWETKGHVTGLRARGGFEVDIAWSSSKLIQLVIRSKLGQPCRVRCGKQVLDLKTVAAETYAFDGEFQKIDAIMPID